MILIALKVSFSLPLSADTPNIYTHIQQYPFLFHPIKNYVTDLGTFSYSLDGRCTEYNELHSLFVLLFLLLLVHTVDATISTPHP